jgi:hypothetical protein
MPRGGQEQRGMAEMQDRKTHIVDADGIGQLSQLL